MEQNVHFFIPRIHASACVDRVRDLPLDESAKSDFLTGLAVLGGLVHDRDLISNLLSKEGLMDLIRESSLTKKPLARTSGPALKFLYSVSGFLGDPCDDGMGLKHGRPRGIAPTSHFS